jgi:hypothetical protein
MRSRGDLKLTMLKGIQVKMRWYDEDVLEVGIAAWNGAFGGEANVYVPIGGLTDAAEKRRVFQAILQTNVKLYSVSLALCGRAGRLACASTAATERDTHALSQRLNRRARLPG